jgi:hypothetical protein
MRPGRVRQHAGRGRGNDGDHADEKHRLEPAAHAVRFLIAVMSLLSCFVRFRFADHGEAQSSFVCNPPHDEAAELSSPERRPPLVAPPIGLEQINERPERPAIAKRVAVHAKGNAWHAPDACLATSAVNELADADERRQKSAGSLHFPQPVQLCHGHPAPRAFTFATGRALAIRGIVPPLCVAALGGGEVDIFRRSIARWKRPLAVPCEVMSIDRWGDGDTKPKTFRSLAFAVDSGM